MIVNEIRNLGINVDFKFNFPIVANNILKLVHFISKNISNIKTVKTIYIFLELL